MIKFLSFAHTWTWINNAASYSNHIGTEQEENLCFVKGNQALEAVDGKSGGHVSPMRFRGFY